MTPQPVTTAAPAQAPAPPAPEAAPHRASLPARLLRSFDAIGLIALLVVLWGAAAIFVPRFATGENLVNILRQSSDLAVAAVGVMFILIVKGIDLSIGSVYGLTSVATVLVLTQTGSLPLALAAGLAVGCLVGLVNGVLSEFLKIPPFIATLGMFYVALALAQMLSNGIALRVPSDSVFRRIAEGSVLGVPVVVVAALVIAVLGWLTLKRTELGYGSVALGMNREATRLSGVPVRKLTVGCYVLGGTLVSAGAILLTSRVQTGEPMLGGSNATFEVITAAVVGGTSLMGGKGNVVGVVIGAIIIRTIGNCITLLNITPLLYQAVMGSLILIALLAEALRTRYTGGRS